MINIKSPKKRLVSQISLSLLTVFLAVNSEKVAFARVAVGDDGSTEERSVEESQDTESTKVNNYAIEKKIDENHRAEYSGRPPTGESAARKYFRKPASSAVAPAPTTTKKVSADEDREHYLAIHIGSFFNTDSYQWGQSSHSSNVGRLMAGLTYRMGSLGGLSDWFIRADFLNYSLPEGSALQLGLIPMIMIPDSSSQFPLYFGVGAGPGVFFNQVQGSSSVAFDYQLVAGVRIFNLIEETGFFLESGLKNHVLLLTQGQFNGFYVAGGAIFYF
jgi:hypothetical protein